MNERGIMRESWLWCSNVGTANIYSIVVCVATTKINRSAEKGQVGTETNLADFRGCLDQMRRFVAALDPAHPVIFSGVMPRTPWNGEIELTASALAIDSKSVRACFSLLRRALASRRKRYKSVRPPQFSFPFTKQPCFFETTVFSS